MHVAVIFMVMVIFIQQLPLDKCVISETIVNVTAIFPLIHKAHFLSCLVTDHQFLK